MKSKYLMIGAAFFSALFGKRYSPAGETAS